MALSSTDRIADCPHCEAHLGLPAEAANGSTVRCSACFQRFEVDDSLVSPLATATLIAPPKAPEPVEPVADELGGAEAASSETTATEPNSAGTNTGGQGAFEPAVSQPTPPEPAATAATDDAPAAESLAEQSPPSLDDWLKASTEKFNAERAATRPRAEPRPVAESDPSTQESKSTDRSADQTPKPAERSPVLSSLLNEFRGETRPEHEATEPTPRGESLSSTPATLPADSNDFAIDLEAPAEAALSTGPVPYLVEDEAEPGAELASASVGYGEAENETGAVAGRSWGIGRALTISAATLAGVGIGYGLLIAIGGAGYDSLGLLAARENQTVPATDQPSDSLAPPAPFAPERASGPIKPAIDDPRAEPAGFASPGDAPAPRFEVMSDAPDLLDAPPPVARGIEPADSAVADEPAAFVPEDPRAGETAAGIGIAGAPQYSAADLKLALSGADQARAELRNHSLAAGDSLALVGRSYAKLCEVAQVMAFAAPDRSHPDMMIQRLESQDLFLRLFRSQHARDDSRQIATRWLSWPDRPHGGVFFAGLPVDARSAGSVYEYQFELGSGAQVAVLSPTPFRTKRFIDATSIGVVGCVIEAPADRIEGYVGQAPRAVWVAHIIPLGDAELE
ncbi:MAG: hypothetical protein AAGB00_00180 [Planctomycetota bacterium]